MIPRIWSLGTPSMPLSSIGTPMLTYTDAASLDANMQRALNKSYVGDTMYGTMTLGAGGKISLDSDFVIFDVNADSTSVTGGRWQCGHGDFVGVSPDLVFKHYFSFAELFGNTKGSGFVGNGGIPWPILVSLASQWLWYMDPGGSAYPGNVTGQTPNSAAVIPLTRMYDRTDVSDVTVSFVVSSSRTTGGLPTRYPAINVYQYDPFLNVLTSITAGGWNYFPTQASMTAYKNGGNANTIDASLSLVTSTDVSKYLYVLAVLDEDYGADFATNNPNEFTGVGLAVNVSDLHFQ